MTEKMTLLMWSWTLGTIVNIVWHNSCVILNKLMTELILMMLVKS